MSTVTETVVEHVRALHPGAFFRLGDLPAPRATASVVMHRVIAAGDPQVERVAPGFFMRRENPGEPRVWRDCNETALVHAGPGGGFAGYTAVNMVGWTTQIPWRSQVCVPGGRRLRPADPLGFVYVSRSSAARAHLTWAEVTMLEAVMRFDLAEVSWGEALDDAENEVCLSRLGAVAHRPFIRSEALRWAAHAERNKPRVFHERIDELCDRLPEVQDWEDYIWRKHPDVAERWGWTKPDPARQETADAS